jgi:putative nucleotidyltransferase with HDIG domain
MVKEYQLLEIKKWFETYTGSFLTGVEKIDSALAVKVRHTKNVGLEILAIANSLDMRTEECYLAELCAVLHDIGRFEQYARYHIYSDSRSEDHAAIGIRVLHETGILNKLDFADQELIRFAVFHHNKASLPDSGDERYLFFLKLLRDADKIDILRVVTDHYHGLVTDDAIGIGLPDIPEISGPILHAITNGTIARVEEMRTLNDFKLLQIGWVFDLNFPQSFETIMHRKYVQKLSEVLPQTDEVKRAVAVALRHAEKSSMNERNICQCQTL